MVMPATLLVPQSPINLLHPSVAEASVAPTYGQTVLRDNPVSYWRLNDTTGRTAVDATGRNNGSIIGGVTLNQPGPAGGSAMRFDGSTGYISIGDPASLRLSHAMTLEAWILNPGGGQQAVLSKWAQNAGTDAYGQYVVVNGDHVGAVGVPGVPQQGVTGTAVLSGRWVHLAATYDAATSALILYMDGAVEKTGTAVGGITVSDVNVEIGKEDSNLNRFFSGTMSEVAVYDHALSAAQVANHYQAAHLGGVPRCQRQPTRDLRSQSADDRHPRQPERPDLDEGSVRDHDDGGLRCPGEPPKHLTSPGRLESRAEPGDDGDLG
jgi:hypothetical protein